MRDVNEGWIEDKTDCLRREWDSSEPRRQDIGILLLLHSIYVIPFKGKGGLVPQCVPPSKRYSTQRPHCIHLNMAND